MKEYEAKDDWQLYLWKENEDFVGIMGIVKKENQVSFSFHKYNCQSSFASYSFIVNCNVFTSFSVGINVVKKENQVLEIQHLSVNPSHRHVGIGTKMVQELKRF
jgi:riboflavin biosynthesis RibT protein